MMDERSFLLKTLFFHSNKNERSIITILILKINMKKMLKELGNKNLQDLNKKNFTDIVCSNYFLYQNFIVL